MPTWNSPKPIEPLPYFDRSAGCGLSGMGMLQGHGEVFNGTFIKSQTHDSYEWVQGKIDYLPFKCLMAGVHDW